MAAMGGAQETKIIYHVDAEETPYLVKIPKPPDQVTLGDFKSVLNRPNYKFFFKSMDDDFGVVKEEIIDDDAPLPCFNGRVVSWVVPPEEGSDRGDGQSQHSGDGIVSTPLVPKLTTARGSGSKSDRDFDSETESVVSRRSSRSRSSRKYDSDVSRRVRHKENRAGEFSDFESMLSSDIETTSFVDSDDDSRLSSATENSRYTGRQRRRKTRKRMPPVERCASFSTITESSMSLNIITVTLNMDKINFLGISIVGQANKRGDGGIYVGSVMKGGAVDADGRIEPGDMILAVGDVNFENMSNDDAVRVLREAVHKPGPITLTVAKCWDQTPKGYFTIPQNETVRPIDPAAWLQHSQAVRASGGLLGRQGAGSPSMSTVTSTTSSSLSSSIPEADRYAMDSDTLGYELTVDTDMLTVVKVMAAADSGLSIRDRMWLKITIPNAFIGADLVDWLFSHVDGFQDRRDARKYASKLLKAGFIRHTVNKITFSEQCYYVFGDLLNSMRGLKINDIDGSEEDSLAPLVQNQSQQSGLGQWPVVLTSTPSAPGMILPPKMQAAQIHMHAAQLSQFSEAPPSYQQVYPGPGYSYFAQHPGSLPPSEPTSYRTGSQSGGSQKSGNSAGRLPSQPDFDQSTVRSSGSSERSAGSRDSKRESDERASLASLQMLQQQQMLLQQQQHAHAALAYHQQQQQQLDNISLHSLALSERSVASVPPDRELGRLDTVPLAISGSRQSFRMAMGNLSNEFFVDVM